MEDDGRGVRSLGRLGRKNSYFNVYVNGVLEMEGI
ncbi:DUF4183 domain-containing protein [Bacillus thuringiensis]|nr:DUF4183 domain-containing protein [Bacillus thuringiensis]